jgi:hypothetical protein
MKSERLSKIGRATILDGPLLGFCLMRPHCLEKVAGVETVGDEVRSIRHHPLQDLFALAVDRSNFIEKIFEVFDQVNAGWGV